MAIPDYTPFLTHLDVVLSIYDKAIPPKAHARPYLPTPAAVELDPEILIPPIKPLQPISSQSVPDSTPSTHPIAQKAEPTPAPSTHVPLPPTASIPIPPYTGPSDWLTDSILRSLGVVVRRMQGAEAFVASLGHSISNSHENGYVNGGGTGSAVSLTNGIGAGVSRSGSMSARRAAQGLATPGRHTVHSAAPSPTSASTVLPGATNGIQEHASKAKGVSANSTAESKTTMTSPFSPIVLGENGENTVRTNSTGEWVFLCWLCFFRRTPTFSSLYYFHPISVFALFWALGNVGPHWAFCLYDSLWSLALLFTCMNSRAVHNLMLITSSPFFISSVLEVDRSIRIWIRPFRLRNRYRFFGSP